MSGQMPCTIFAHASAVPDLQHTLFLSSRKEMHFEPVQEHRNCLFPSLHSASVAAWQNES